MDEEIIQNRKTIFHTRNPISILSVIPFSAHAAGAIPFANSGKRNQKRRKRTGRPLDSACLIAVAYATSKAYSEVYGRFMCPRFCK